MKKRNRQILKSKRAWVQFLKTAKRKERYRLRKVGFKRHQFNMKQRALTEGRKYKASKRTPFFYEKKLPPKPDYPQNIKYLLTVPELFSKNQFNQKEDGHLFLPKCFSLIENYEESFDFLKRLFVVLQRNKVDGVILDYSKCERIDVDASICMDVLLAEFIHYINRCRSLGYFDVFSKGIIPINFEKDNILKVLLSIGAFRNIKGVSKKFKDVEGLPVLINDQNREDVWARSEIDQTKIVEYIKRCIRKLGRELPIEEETSFYKVIGEVMSNAEEHGTMPHRFAIGYFQETHNDDEHYGFFNFSIFNFGDTIYQTFKKDECLNKKAVNQMSMLSGEYTKKGWFKKATFEEETLWTLYALQEGVTSKEKKRGNGSIQYIENFFKLKGDLNKDNISSMVIVSGNTRILFDGEYNIIEKVKEGEKRKYKMITFNKSGDINDEPDKKYVTFAPHFFPGTMISARILIKFDNTNEQTNGKRGI
jgi:hypothetical protein